MNRQGVFAGPALLGVTILTAGCASTTPPVAPDTTPTAFERPGWMVEQAQANEELAAFQERCLTEAGIAFETDGSGGFEWPAGTSGANEQLADCTKQFLGDLYGAAPSTEQYEALYERQLQTRSCLIEEGYTIEEPISREAYVDSGGQWSAYNSLHDDFSSMAPEELAAEQRRLRELCPEPDLTGLR